MLAAADKQLRGRCIWLTRPAAQIEALQLQLLNLGAGVVSLPLLTIESVPLAGINKQRILNLDHYDLVFFVSSNAAALGLEAINSYWPQYPAGIKNFAVGPGTAAVLQQQGLEVAYPTERMSSEAMLELPALQDIKGKKALIVRGVGGREILAKALVARGASVDYVELYQRNLPRYAPDYLQQHYTQTPPDAVVISSAEALDNLKTLYAPLGVWSLLPLAVSSERLAKDSLELGVTPITILAGATDAAIIAGLIAHFAQGSPA